MSMASNLVLLRGENNFLHLEVSIDFLFYYFDLAPSRSLGIMITGYLGKKKYRDTGYFMGIRDV